ncbi:MAG: GGDEF domain-containing protein [Henriciella sp.]|uniref:GGDEF domain-containing protein n=1 Tax=Henriciella sp. TaxID=1968823 RepID=UPI0032EE99F1
MSAIFLSFWYYNRSDRSALRFAAAFLMCALGFSINHFVLDKDTLANAIVHNTFYAAGLYLLLDGIHGAFGRKVPKVILALIGAGSVIGAIIVQVSPAELNQRILWINAVQGCMLVVSAFTLWGIWKRNWTGTATYAALCLCIVNMMTVAPYYVIRSMITEDTFFQTMYWGTMNVVATLSVLAMGGALISACVMQRLDLLRADAENDYLTGLKTRRAFEEAARLYCSSRSGDVAATLILIDLDHFKEINDDHGHTVGDQVISRFGSFLLENTRTSDMAGRMGGEEFCLLLPGTDTNGARQLATRLRETLSTLGFEGLPDKQKITASFGVAELGQRTAFGDIYPQADAALYSAKTRGRDRVVCATPPNDAGKPIRREIFLALPDGSRIPASRMAS